MTYEISVADLDAAGLLVFIRVGESVTAAVDDYNAVNFSTPDSCREPFESVMSLTRAEALDLAWGLVEAIEFHAGSNHHEA